MKISGAMKRATASLAAVAFSTVEAGCNTLIGQRLKLSGMRWNIPGATGIITLRCHRASNRWVQIWPHPNNQTPTVTAA